MIGKQNSCTGGKPAIHYTALWNMVKFQKLNLGITGCFMAFLLIEVKHLSVPEKELYSW